MTLASPFEHASSRYHTLAPFPSQPATLRPAPIIERKKTPELSGSTGNG